MRLLTAFALVLLPLAATAAKAPRTAREAERVGNLALVAHILKKPFAAPAGTSVKVDTRGPQPRIAMTVTRPGGLQTHRTLTLDGALRASEQVRITELGRGRFSARVTLYGTADTYRARVSKAGHVTEVALAGQVIRYYPRTGLTVYPRGESSEPGAADVYQYKPNLDPQPLVSKILTPASREAYKRGWARNAAELERIFGADMKP